MRTEREIYDVSEQRRSRKYSEKESSACDDSSKSSGAREI